MNDQSFIASETWRLTDMKTESVLLSQLITTDVPLHSIGKYLVPLLLVQFTTHTKNGRHHV